MVRLFIGIAIPAEIRFQLSLMASGIPGARWTPEESYHLTLRFIGEVDQGMADDIDDTLRHIRVAPFELALSGVGYFGSGRSARALWVGVAKNEALLHLQAKLETALQRMGLPAEERKYTPHVTLARLRNTRAARLETYIADHAGFQAPPFRVTEFTLFSSFLSSSGPIYTPELTYEMI